MANGGTRGKCVCLNTASLLKKEDRRDGKIPCFWFKWHRWLSWMNTWLGGHL